MANPVQSQRLSSQEESLLTGAASNGDRAAFASLYSAFNGAVIGSILRKLTWIGRDEAKEIAQKVWIETWEKIRMPSESGGFDNSKGRFFTWLYSYIIKFAILDHGAARSTEIPLSHLSRSEDEEGEDRMSCMADPDTENSPDIVLEKKEELRKQAEKLRRIYLAYGELLRWLFLCGGYPHQQLAYAFSKLIFGHESNRGIEGSPQRLRTEYAEIPLVSLQRVFWESYSKESRIPGDILNTCKCHMHPLDKRLTLSVKELTRLDHASNNQFAPFLNSMVAETFFKQYWENHRSGFISAVPDWCYKVKQRLLCLFGLEKTAEEKDLIRSLVTEEKAIGNKHCNRCKLRHVAPCAEEEQR
jgi:hypothetical protein